jgi:hypothetical protein
MLTLNLTSDGSPGDVALAKSLEFNLGVRVVIDYAVDAVHTVPVDEPHPVLEKDVVQTPAAPIPSFSDLLNQQVPPAEVVESSP